VVVAITTPTLDTQLTSKYYVDTEINKKQDTITTSTDLTANSITLTDLNVTGNINLDKTTYFDTIVIRRLNEADTTFINLTELQVWVNGSNILFPNSTSLTGYFAIWANKQIDIGSYDNNNFPVSNIYNNIFEADLGACSPQSSASALIIKNIPLTSINEIQAIVLYNRITSSDRARGLFFELYNSTNDPDLTEVLANTNVITTATARYRFDFPSIDTYTEFVGENSITNIVSNSIASTEEANVISFSTELTGELVSNINTTLADILSRLELLENP
jgi:hypothetical protein